MKKQAILDVLDQLPQEFTTDEIIEKIIFIEKIEKGLLDIREGRVITLEEAKSRTKKWLK